MRLLFWVTAVAVLSLTWAKNSTLKTKPKRQLDNIRTPQNLQYSLVLPHSRVAHFRSLSNNKRSSSGVPKGKLPPYAVQMEPVVQYSQKDPLYDPNHDKVDEVVENKNEIHAQSKILNVDDQSGENFGPPYGSLPTAPLYSHDAHPHYYEAPEPIIEIIIKESNETLPAPQPQPIQKKKKEPVHVFYVKYSKDPHSKDKVIYEKPIPAITPSTNEEDDHHDEYVTVTPEPIYLPAKTTTLRAIIKPESEVYHSDSSVKITFGNEGRHYSDRRDGQTEDHEETAPQPAIAFPNQPLQQTHPALERSASPKPQFVESVTRPNAYLPNPSVPTFKSESSHAQSRIQFQPQYFPTEQQLPRQSPSASTFRSQSHIPRNPFGASSSLIPNPAFANGPTGPIFERPTASSPVSPAFPPTHHRANPPFQSRPNNPPSFGTRLHVSGPPRTSFPSGPQRPFHPPQSKPNNYFDEAKYLQENYHTITTDQVSAQKDQALKTRPTQNLNHLTQPSPSPTPAHFQEHFRRPPIIPLNQQLPQQKPPKQFSDTVHSQTSFTASPSNSPFFNLKPSPPQIDSRPLFHQGQQPLSFHNGPLPSSRPSLQFGSVSPSPPSSNPFLPQPSSPTLYNFHQQLPVAQDPKSQFHIQNSPTERPFQQTHNPSERPPADHQGNYHEQSKQQHQQTVNQFVPNGGELVPSISEYEQHITLNGPTASPSFDNFSTFQPSPTPSQPDIQYQQQQQRYQQQEQHQQQQKYQQQQRQHHQEHQQQQRQHHQEHQQQQNNQQQQQQRIRQQQEQQQHQYDAEQEQVRLQLAQNVQKQQEEIQRLQAQLLQSQEQQQQHQQFYKQTQNNYNQQFEATSSRSQYIQERSRPQPTYVSSTSSPQYYQSTSGSVEIGPTTPKYVSSTANSVSSTPETKKEEKKNKPTIELPDEVPDDLRQQLLSSGILDNADISVLDYDKVGDTPLDSLPPDQLANFFSAGGAQQISSSENRPIVVKPDGSHIESRIDQDMEDDQEEAASENVPSYVAPPKQAVEMKVVHFDPKTPEGQKIADDYVQENATQIDPVALNDKKYNRYLPLKVSGNQFPLPDILKGRKITSVVVLAPVETEVLNGDHTRTERAAENNLKGIKFVAGDSLQDLLKRPTKDNFEKWLQVEKMTASDLQSIVLLVTTNDESTADKEIYMYDITSGNINKLSGELSNAFVEAAENNSLSKDIESLAIEGEGIPENFNRKDDNAAEGSENVPLFVDLSGVSIDKDKENSKVLISSGYSKTKHGRSLRRH
ncbi:alpha-protein kinase 1 [Bombyx mori]|uniref:HSA domain-containing protein n=1 Tax=Bombyx mori TaxID=7091 RepID=A0A8R2M464_BOMMO|nr:alpha-protein kinase 1 [Bombyx mori]